MTTAAEKKAHDGIIDAIGDKLFERRQELAALDPSLSALPRDNGRWKALAEEAVYNRKLNGISLNAIPDGEQIPDAKKVDGIAAAMVQAEQEQKRDGVGFLGGATWGQVGKAFMNHPLDFIGAIFSALFEGLMSGNGFDGIMNALKNKLAPMITPVVAEDMGHSLHNKLDELGIKGKEADQYVHGFENEICKQGNAPLLHPPGGNAPGTANNPPGTSSNPLAVLLEVLKTQGKEAAEKLLLPTVRKQMELNPKIKALEKVALKQGESFSSVQLDALAKTITSSTIDSLAPPRKSLEEASKHLQEKLNECFEKNESFKNTPIAANPELRKNVCELMATQLIAESCKDSRFSLIYKKEDIDKFMIKAAKDALGLEEKIAQAAVEGQLKNTLSAPDGVMLRGILALATKRPFDEQSEKIFIDTMKPVLGKIAVDIQHGKLDETKAQAEIATKLSSLGMDQETANAMAKNMLETLNLKEPGKKSDLSAAIDTMVEERWKDQKQKLPPMFQAILNSGQLDQEKAKENIKTAMKKALSDPRFSQMDAKAQNERIRQELVIALSNPEKGALNDKSAGITLKLSTDLGSAEAHINPKRSRELMAEAIAAPLTGQKGPDLSELIKNPGEGIEIIFATPPIDTGLGFTVPPMSLPSFDAQQGVDISHGDLSSLIPKPIGGAIDSGKAVINGIGDALKGGWSF